MARCSVEGIRYFNHARAAGVSTASDLTYTCNRSNGFDSKLRSAEHNRAFHWVITDCRETDILDTDHCNPAGETLERVKRVHPERAARTIAQQLAAQFGNGKGESQFDCRDDMRFGYSSLPKRKAQRRLAPVYMATHRRYPPQGAPGSGARGAGHGTQLSPAASARARGPAKHQQQDIGQTLLLLRNFEPNQRAACNWAEASD